MSELAWQIMCAASFLAGMIVGYGITKEGFKRGMEYYRLNGKRGDET